MRVLVVEDETLLAQAMTKRLSADGHNCTSTATLRAANDHLRAKAPPDLVLLDVRLPDGNGLDLMAQARSGGPAFVVVTAFGDVEDAVTAMKQGASDYLRKPLDLNELSVVVDRIAEIRSMKEKLHYARTRDARVLDGEALLGESPALVRLREQIRSLASISGVEPSAPLPNILILGETGTGKDLAARYLHASSPRADQPYVHVDCAVLPSGLIESELFGHAKGAYTGAQAARAGLIEAAEGGTLFLDEIGELPVNLQAKLLNVVERRRVRRIGSTGEIEVGARFIAATNRDLAKMVRERTFREDLYYRLNALTVAMPPLRSCAEDIPRLAAHFAAQVARRFGKPPPQWTDAAVQRLRDNAWPGNVRELRHVVERAVITDQDARIDVADLALDAHSSSPRAPATVEAYDGLTLEQAERALIERALARTGGNVSQAARQLDVSRMALRYRIDKYRLRDSG